MDCKEYRKLLSAFVDEALDPQEEELLMAHLEECEACKEELSQLYLLKQMCGKIDVPKLPNHFHRELMKKVEAEEQKKLFGMRKWKWQYSSALVAAVAVIILGLSSLKQVVKQPISDEESAGLLNELSMASAQGVGGNNNQISGRSISQSTAQSEEISEQITTWKVTVDEPLEFKDRLQTYLKDNQISYEEMETGMICYPFEKRDELSKWIKSYVNHFEVAEEQGENGVHVIIE